jgi:hypothetical protein
VYTLDVASWFAELVDRIRVIREELEHRGVENATALSLVAAYSLCRSILEEEIEKNDEVGYSL